MRRHWLGLIGVALAVCGCTTPDSQAVKPPIPKAEYLLPPSNDDRWSNPPAYPEKVLSAGEPRKSEATNGVTPAGGFGGASSTGGGPRPGSAGFGGGGPGSMGGRGY